ncbi:MAG: inositol oxygenase [Alphaproteobacteria bacterium]|nr:inositol oxygenase [Alphaproteobacteria bacterium]MBL7100227.1 inositol oxygenase [Alphaproteobacteria bacterium]
MTESAANVSSPNASLRVDLDKKVEDFRAYEPAPERVHTFYRLNHAHQTRAFVQAKKQQYLGLDHRRMGIWPALEYLNTLVDDSDPDTELSQIDHCLQTAEAIRRDGHPDWFQLAGLVHDLGKVLCLWGEPQWAVVGDTFPTGCAYSPKIVLSEYLKDNPDNGDPRYQTRLGVYEENCGFDKVDLSWGHDEYMYHVARPYLPEPALYMLRYHSFYAAHREDEYAYLMDDRDREMFAWVKLFNQYDLYSKDHAKPDATALRPYYEALIEKYFPAQVRF